MIIAITSLHPGGATFLDWSYHYLKGNDTFWHLEKGWLPLPEDPLVKMNAHAHGKNHPGEYHLWHQFVETAKVEIQKNQKDISFYPSRLPHMGELVEWVQNINCLVNNGVNVVILKKTMEYPYATERSDLNEEYDIESFYLENPEIEKGTSRNKLRELSSLRIIPQQKKWIESIDRAFDSLSESVVVINDTDYINKTEDSVKKVFNQLDLQIDPDRLIQWRPIRDRWNQIYWEGLKFYRDLPIIIDNVSDGVDFDLTTYDIGFFQESLIMAYLMKQKGKRLVIHGDNFPKNTKELHKFIKTTRYSGQKTDQHKI